jgi:thymidylate synthase
MHSYHELIKTVVKYGEPHQDRTRVGTTSLFGYQWRHNMNDGFPLITTKHTPINLIGTELAWMLEGKTHENWLKMLGCHIWKPWATAEQCAKFGRELGDLGPVYGGMLRRFPNGYYLRENGRWEMYRTEDHCIDQIKQLVEDCKTNNNSRRLIVSLWHPYWARRVTVPPCQISWQVKIHHDKEISLHVSSRSSDAFVGLPFDMASHALTLHLLANELELKPRELIISFGDLHLYDNHRKGALEMLKRAPRPLPSIKVYGGILQTNWGYTLSDYDPWPSIKAEVAV